MSGLRSTTDWGDLEGRDQWHGARSEVMFLATGLGWASLVLGGWVALLVGLALRRDDRTADYPDFDL
jgi:hypothetical protein